MTVQILKGLAVFALSYLVGSIPFGFLIGKFNGLDIRQHGSHNIGATNVLRVLGKDWGYLCFALDFLKGLLPVWLFGCKLSAAMGFPPVAWGELVAVVGAILGHCFPFVLKFKGGKGVATSLGAVLAIAFWPVLVSGIVWYLTFLKTRIVAIASLAAAASLPIASLVMYYFHFGGIHVPAIILMAAICALIIWRHKDNIARIRAKTENTFEKNSKDK